MSLTAGPAPHIIKSTPAWWRWCLEFALRRWRDNNCEHLATFWTRKKTGSNTTTYTEIYLHVFPGDERTEPNLTFFFSFSIRSCFLVLRRSERPPHPHKETLLARLLTRTQVKGQIWASLKTCPPSSGKVALVELAVSRPSRICSGNRFVNESGTEFCNGLWLVITSGGRVAGNFSQPACQHQCVHTAPPRTLPGTTCSVFLFLFSPPTYFFGGGGRTWLSS